MAGAALGQLSQGKWPHGPTGGWGWEWAGSQDLSGHFAYVVQAYNLAGGTQGPLNRAKPLGTQFPKFPKTQAGGEAAMGSQGSGGSRNC